ncbi:FAD binding domain-containing protein [Skermanella mucosa]|uniref:FAD binding domain-containing protein n=1 Tax=Skermanella mucosa TaxID=1789672 RepID=UPI00192AC5BE|nr:FAD binding domain-containing protein [Skermanella mucosa]UEM19823.1 FAD binding domain-containing protein [Skermanella mucosa]
MKPAPFDLTTARDAAEAAALTGDGSPEARIVAGGQSLGPMLNLRLARPAHLVDISRAADLRAVTDEGDRLLYGAAVTHAEIEDGAVPDATGGWLREIAGRIAYRAVRNRGTLGGSLVHADPAADWVVTLTALGAEAVVADPAGAVRVEPLATFIAGPFATTLRRGEILTGVRIAKRGPQARWGYWKFTRKVGEFAKASAAVLIDDRTGEVRLVAGAIERPPILLPDAGAVLSGTLSAEEALRRALPDRPARTLALHAVALREAIDIAAGRPHRGAA